jgi:hypothetical protein
MARRSRWIRALLWRVFFVVLVGTMLLGLVLFLRRGPEALVENFLSIAPGTETTVVVDRLNLRAAPTVDGQLIAVVQRGSEVRVTGLSETNAEFRFWPIETEIGGNQVTGWAWEGGLQANEWTGRLSWVQDVVDQIQDGRERVSNGWQRVSGWLPGALGPHPAL